MTILTPILAITAIAVIVGSTQVRWNQVSEMVLSVNTEVTNTPTMPPTPSPTISPTNTPTPSPKPTKIPATPTPTRKPMPKYSAEEIYNMINKYAGEKGVNPDVIRHIGVCESGLRADAKNYIYGGMFQYDPATWKSFRRMMNENPDPDLRFDAKEAIRTTVYLVALGKLHLWPNCRP